jgi:hypothetical protein
MPFEDAGFQNLYMKFLLFVPLGNPRRTNSRCQFSTWYFCFYRVNNYTFLLLRQFSDSARLLLHFFL